MIPRTLGCLALLAACAPLSPVSGTGADSKAPTCTVELGSPADGYGAMSAAPPTFDWTGNCESYTLELSYRSSFPNSGTLRFETTNETFPIWPFLWSFVTNIADDTVYWHVVGKASNKKNESDLREIDLTFDEPPPPEDTGTPPVDTGDAPDLPAFPGTLDVSATMASASLELSYDENDDDPDATAVPEWRASGGEWHAGHPLVRMSGPRWVGSVLFLEADTDYEVRVRVDAASGSTVSPTEAFSTRKDTPDASTGDVWVVDAAHGNDSGAGSAASPYATIQKGMNAAGPGDTVLVKPGTYYETVTPPTSGSEGNPITVKADGAGVILTGADKTIAQGGATWTSVGSGVYSTSFNGEGGYLSVDGVRLYDYQSLTSLKEENGNIGVVGSTDGGFYHDKANSKLYVLMADGSSPSGNEVRVSRYTWGFYVGSRHHLVIDGLTIRDYGRTGDDGVGVDLNQSSDCWIRNNTFEHLNTAVKSRNSGGSRNVVELNTYRDTSVYEWPWDSVKAHTAEGTAITMGDGDDNVIRWNDIEGAFNGIDNGTWESLDEAPGRGADIYENTLRYIGDDGLEFDASQVNVRAWGNTVDHVFNAISISPVHWGPLYLVRNALLNYTEHAFKPNYDTTGVVFIYHTTALAAPGSEGSAIEPEGPFGGITMRNNILHATFYVIEYEESSLGAPIDWDYDALWCDDSYGRFVKWKNVKYSSIGSLAALGEIEVHGFEEALAFTDMAGSVYDLPTGHPLRDAGQIIPGINDLDYTGAGPDVGAWESGGVAPGR